tara:strand:- start:4112 stop:4345 length:234 start_codon:yes stop_codon:yes gene_type:complete
MGILQIIMLVLTYGPKLFSLVSEIIDMMKKLKGHADEPKFTADFETALNAFRLNKDRRPLREFRDKLYHHCDAACLK